MSKYGLAAGAIALLIEKLAELLEAEGERVFVVGKSTLSQLKRGLGDANRFGQAIAGAKGFEFLIENSPKVFFTLHRASPALAELADQLRRQSFGSQGQRLAFVGHDVGANKKAGRTR